MQKTFKYGLIGSSGRLGKEVVSVFSEKNHRLVFEFDIDGKKQKEKPELLIDCSLPEVFKDTINFVKDFNVPLIIATTGLPHTDLENLKEISARVPVVQSFNFSVGIQVLLNITEIASKKLDGWDIEIIETHHRFKKDKPSGTAKMIKEAIDRDNVNISSLRLGNVFGEHTVSFGSLGEVLSISHSATSRRTFAEGILISAEFVINKANGFYSFKDILFRT
jgi:4-hydroxy-tetrahydrodipicolinate reductase